MIYPADYGISDMSMIYRAGYCIPDRSRIYTTGSMTYQAGQ